MRPLANVIGFDDGPFERRATDDVLLVGAVCARTRLDGVVSTRVAHDGDDATARIADLVTCTKFAAAVRAIALSGIAVAGLNVVDVHELAARTGRPVLVVARRPPRLDRLRRALNAIPDGARKWALVEAAGAMEQVGALYVQRVGLSVAQAGALLAASTLHGNFPEPLRLAHLIAGGIERGVSRGRA